MCTMLPACEWWCKQSMQWDVKEHENYKIRKTGTILKRTVNVGNNRVLC
jgi:hypothetical protein